MVQPERKQECPSWDAGTVNLHGKAVTMISVRALFGLPEADPHLTDMLIIARAGSSEVALWVDSTSGVMDIPLFADTGDALHHHPREGNGTRRTADGIVVIYDLPGLIASGGITAGIPVGERAPATIRTGPLITANGESIPDTGHINAVLAERAKKISRPEDEMSDKKTAEVLMFRLAYREYAIDMQHIREVILTGEITPVPGTPDFISGICVVRGEIISLVDLRVLLAIPEAGLTDLNRVIVLTDQALTFGILADHITGIGTIELDRITASDPDSPIAGSKYVKGIADGTLVVLDTGAFFSDPKMIVDEA
jgi:purine-binding chemotaxis protein CheW